MPRNDELLFLETEGSCAYCGHKDRRDLTIHHIAESKRKNEDYDNKIILCHNCHQRHHRRNEPTTEEIEEIKLRLIKKTLTTMGLNAMKYAHRRGAVEASPFLVSHLVEYGYLAEGEMISSWALDVDSPSVVTSSTYTITDEGKALLIKWKLK